MDKLLLLSLIFATIIIPVLFSRSASPRRGLIRTVIAMAVFAIFYVFMLIFVAIRFIDTTPPPPGF